MFVTGDEEERAVPLTREYLDEAICSTPGCDEEHGPLYLHSRCHPEAPTWTLYEDGVLRVECAECREEVAIIRVA